MPLHEVTYYLLTLVKYGVVTTGEIDDMDEYYSYKTDKIMASKINTHFSEELKKYGAVNFNACYNCGNCTAVCSLSTPEESFPREMVRLSTLVWRMN